MTWYIVCNEKDCRVYSHMDNVKEDEKEGYKLVDTAKTHEEAFNKVENKFKKQLGYRNIDWNKAFPEK